MAWTYPLGTPLPAAPTSPKMMCMAKRIERNVIKEYAAAALRQHNDGIEAVSPLQRLSRRHGLCGRHFDADRPPAASKRCWQMRSLGSRQYRLHSTKPFRQRLQQSQEVSIRPCPWRTDNVPWMAAVSSHVRGLGCARSSCDHRCRSILPLTRAEACRNCFARDCCSRHHWRAW